MATRPYRAEMGAPPANIEDMKTAPAPLTEKQRMGKMVIGSRKDLKPGDRRMLNPVLEPVEGEEVSVEKVTKKKFASGGSASSRGDGIAKRGKTRGKVY